MTEYLDVHTDCSSDRVLYFLLFAVVCVYIKVLK